MFVVKAAYQAMTQGSVAEYLRFASYFVTLLIPGGNRKG